MRKAATYADVAERSKAPVLKTEEANNLREFESLHLRHGPYGPLMLTGRPFWPPGENGGNALRDTPTETIAPLWHGATPGEKPHGKLTNHDSLLIRRAAPADGKFAIVCYTSGRTYAHFKPDSDTAESKDMPRRGLLTWGFTNPGNQNGTLNVPTPAVARQKLGRSKTISRCRAVNSAPPYCGT